MGQEAHCELRFAGKKSAGKALLETDDLIFRGDFRLSIPLKSIQSLESADGILRVTSPAGTAMFILGTQADKWAHRIRNPRTLADKLDVKPGMRVSLIGVANPLEGRTSDVTEGKAAKDSDLIFFGAETDKDLAKLRTLQESIKRNGAIWVVYPKAQRGACPRHRGPELARLGRRGRAPFCASSSEGRKEITEIAVLNAGRQAGLVDIKVARFSDTHTAHKFVIPSAKR